MKMMVSGTRADTERASECVKVNSTVPREQLRMRTVVVLYRRMRNELQSGRERTNVRNSGKDSEHKNQLREWEREGGVGKAKRSKVRQGIDAEV